MPGAGAVAAHGGVKARAREARELEPWRAGKSGHLKNASYIYVLPCGRSSIGFRPDG
ncbi:hypothetical protein GCM10010269_63370 [Streptomyces humidus]|uniref:Uncharacterized protein n=1 Tax=Streptomyces humidus TaxID=52259 RepID=A0A918G2M5_9ACTN|nr:hypothetical protein GCM10010269_63370 [Streptomyces humidus]